MLLRRHALKNSLYTSVPCVQLRLKVLIKSDADLLSAPETSIVDKLRREGFSPSMVSQRCREAWYTCAGEYSSFLQDAS